MRLITLATIAVLAVGGLWPRDTFAQARVQNLTLTRPGQPTVRYALSIPENYSPTTKVPLVLALHFGGDPAGAGRAVLDILIGPGLAELGAIIVSPDSLSGGWDSAENDRAVIQLLDTVLANYSIDTTKILVTGFSMGGAGTWHFGSKYPQRFTAAIPLAGRPTPAAAGWKLPILAIHSRIDEVVPFGPAEARIAELKKAGIRAELIAVDNFSHYQTFRFVAPLRQAVPWLKEVWKSK